MQFRMQSDLNFRYCHLTSSVSLEICFQCHLSFYLQERFSCGEVIKSTLAASSTGVLKKWRERRKEASGKGRKRPLCGTVLFVGIPLPGTGAWTGTLAASLLDMDFKNEHTCCYVWCRAGRHHHGISKRRRVLIHSVSLVDAHELLRYFVTLAILKSIRIR